MKQIQSFYLKLIIEFQRITDHLWRDLTGFPTLRRSMITPNIYLGGQYSLKALPLFKKLGVTAVVNMRTSSIHYDPNTFTLEMLHLPTPDQTAPTLGNLKKGVAFIDTTIQKGGKVYIHCMHGEGRGPSMAIAYLMYKGLTYDDAYQQVQKVRTFIKITSDQKQQLKKFEKTLLGTN